MSGSVIGAMVFGVLLTAIAFAHPIGPALMLGAETPFDAIPFAIFGVLGNLITYVPIIIFLIRINPAHWGQVFFGTRIQQFIAMFVMALLVAHVMSITGRGGIGVIFEWLRKVTLFTVVGVFAYGMRDPKHLSLLFKTMVASMAVFTLLAMLDFYLGIQILPVKAGLMETAALDTEYQNYLATNWRFTGPGYPVNRYSNYLLLLMFLGVGWFMHTRNPAQRVIAFSCASILVLGELFTVTRSGILGMAVGMIVMLPMALRFRIQHVLGLVVLGTVLGGLVWYGVALTSADQVIASRFDPTHVVASGTGRLTRIIAAFKIWAAHPFVGVGWGRFAEFSPEFVERGGKGAHNGYTNVLAETGLLGFIPLMIMTVAVFRRILTRVGQLSPEHEFWRPYFFCGLVAQMVTNVFNDYLWERYLWATFAYVVALEHCYVVARAKAARARLEESRNLGPREPQPFAARVS